MGVAIFAHFTVSVILFFNKIASTLIVMVRRALYSGRTRYIKYAESYSWNGMNLHSRTFAHLYPLIPLSMIDLY